MKFLITGGAGFIGSHLGEALVKKGHTVVVVDNLSTGSRTNIEHIPNLIFIEGDVNSLEFLTGVFADHKFDGIFHYAAVVGVKRTLENPVEVLDDIIGTRNILELALKNGKPKVVFASSSEVYGEPVEIPEIESGHLNPKLPYAVTKLYCEKLMEAYWTTHKLPTVSLRFFNVYGPKQESSDYGFVVGIFIKNVLSGKSPMVFGDGTQTRDFVFISDNVDAAILAMESDAANGEVFNVGTGRPITILNLAEDIISEIGANSLTPSFVEARQDVKHRFPDVSKIRKQLGFRAKTSLKDGLKLTIDWYSGDK